MSSQFPILRADPITGRRVVLAPDRAERPQLLSDGHQGEQEDQVAACPFCEHRESETPGEVAAIREAGSSPNTPGWQVRVLPNKYPALVPEVAEVAPGVSSNPDALQSPALLQTPGVGIHEVLIESPRHLRWTHELDASSLQHIFLLYQQRMRAYACDPRIKSAQVFKNVGRAAGASLAHLHSQLLALPLIGPVLQEELTAAAQLYSQHGVCPYCRLIEQETAAGVRLVAESAGFVCLSAYAARVPYELWILPRDHGCRFEQASEASVAEFAGFVHQVISRLERTLPGVAYNYLIHSAPFDSQPLVHYHWHMEILPRSTTLAGFEWGTGLCINPVLPERAAARLRE